VIGTLAIDGWAVTFGTARRGLGGLRDISVRTTETVSPLSRNFISTAMPLRQRQTHTHPDITENNTPFASLSLRGSGKDLTG